MLPMMRAVMAIETVEKNSIFFFVCSPASANRFFVLRALLQYFELFLELFK